MGLGESCVFAPRQASQRLLFQQSRHLGCSPQQWGNPGQEATRPSRTNGFYAHAVDSGEARGPASFRHPQYREERQDIPHTYISVGPCHCVLRYILMSCAIVRTPQGHPFVPQIQAALANQAARMEHAAAEEKARKAAAAEASRKRQTSGTPVADAPDSKRPKLEHDAASGAAPAFDFSALPATLVTDLIVANLQAFTENALIGLVQAYRHKRSSAATAGIPGLGSTPPPAGPSRVSAPSTATPPPTAPRAPPSEPRADRDRKPKSASPPPPPPPVAVPVKQEEPVDPLKMDIDDEEMEYEPDKLNLEVVTVILCLSDIVAHGLYADVWWS